MFVRSKLLILKIRNNYRAKTCDSGEGDNKHCHRRSCKQAVKQNLSNQNKLVNCGNLF